MESKRDESGYNNTEEIRRNTGQDYIEPVLEDRQENEDKHQHQVGEDGV